MGFIVFFAALIAIGWWAIGLMATSGAGLIDAICRRNNEDDEVTDWDNLK
jgi:hypothetical protein